jgi:formylmethanofuran dehydrogenase subunit C
MALELTYRQSTSIPVEVEGITPEVVQPKERSEIERMPIFVGNQPAALADLFQVAGDPSDGVVQWRGDLTGVHWIGARMNSGLMQVRGDAGRHVGSEMSGGRIEVSGNAGDWVGAEMKAGEIHVRGSAGHLIGAAYRGSRRGMTGGTILIDGDVGNEIGHTMRRGLLAVGGSAGDLIGFNMLAGTILVFGNVGIRHGAGMKRGTIGLFGSGEVPLLPSFRYGCRYRPTAMTLILDYLRELDFVVPADLFSSDLELHHGDMIEGGRGELLRPAS